MHYFAFRKLPNVSYFSIQKKCRLEHVVNKLMSCLITEFLWIFSYKLHGILSNSMDTLWHSMKLHRYFREPHGIPWNSTIFPGIPWTSKETPWNFMAFHGTPWMLHGFPSISMEFHGFPWFSLEFHGSISHGKTIIRFRFRTTRNNQCLGNLFIQDFSKISSNTV